MNHLDHLAAFQAVLQSYQPSDTAKALLQQIPLVLMVGPTSSGRNTIINELLQTGDYHYIVSDTTRQPRANNGIMEQSGREYWFRTETELLRDLQQGLFLEAAVIHNQQVSGISIRELAQAKDDGKIAVNEIEVVGADNIFAAKPDTKFLFILPPSFDEWMVRITSRGQLPEDEMQRRLESAVDEIGIALERDYYHFFVNNTFKQTTRAVDAFIKTGVHPEALQTEGLTVARQLLADIKQHLGR
jgi:guanylate kinase